MEGANYGGKKIPASFMNYARKRKRDYGINIVFTIKAALEFALANKEHWAKNYR